MQLATVGVTRTECTRFRRAMHALWLAAILWKGQDMATESTSTVEHAEETTPPVPSNDGQQEVGGEPGAGKRSTLKQRGMKKYQIVVPESLFEEIEKIADSRQTTVIDIIRRFLKLGLLTARIENTPNAGLFIREGDSEREIILL